MEINLEGGSKVQSTHSLDLL